MGKEGDLFGIDELRLWIPEWKYMCFRYCDPGLEMDLQRGSTDWRSIPILLTAGVKPLGITKRS